MLRNQSTAHCHNYTNLLKELFTEHSMTLHFFFLVTVKTQFFEGDHGKHEGYFITLASQR